MSKTVWYSGPPPAPGWWPASFVGDERAIRWWDGEFWSLGAYCNVSAKEAAQWAAIKEVDIFQPKIKWSERWWVEDCKHDLANPLKVGRATWVCRNCGRDISLDLLCLVA